MAAEDEEHFGYFYGEEEDKGLLDPAWERQQKKVLLKLHCLLIDAKWLAVRFRLDHWLDRVILELSFPFCVLRLFSFI